MEVGTQTAAEWLLEQGWDDIHVREFPDRSLAWVARFAFTHAILFAHRRSPSGYEDRWCFESRQLAIDALKEWNRETDAEPMGWHRHPDTGRRRPEGDPEKEYINL